MHEQAAPPRHLVRVDQGDPLPQQHAAQQREGAKQGGEGDGLREGQARRVIHLRRKKRGGGGVSGWARGWALASARARTRLGHRLLQPQTGEAGRTCGFPQRAWCSREPLARIGPRLEPVCEPAHAGAVAVRVGQHHHLSRGGWRRKSARSCGHRQLHQEGRGHVERASFTASPGVWHATLRCAPCAPPPAGTATAGRCGSPRRRCWGRRSRTP